MEEKIESMFASLSADSKPIVVWLVDISDDATVKKIDGTIMSNEKVGLALKNFRCYQLSVLDIPDEKLRQKYTRETPGFYFFDPGANFVKKVAGRRAQSLSSFRKLVDYTWNKSFTMRLSEFQKRMKNVLDSLDKVDVKRKAIDRDKEKLEERPNPGLARKVKAAEDELNEMKTAVEAEEKGILDDCTLLPEFLPEGEGAEEN